MLIICLDLEKYISAIQNHYILCKLIFKYFFESPKSIFPYEFPK